MARKRRIEYLLSIILLAAGASLLVYAAATYYLPQTAPFAGRPLLLKQLPSELPPALAPAPRIAQESEAFAPLFYDGLSQAPLLPESPLNAAQESTEKGHEAAALPQRSTSAPQRIIIPTLGVDAPVYTIGLEKRRQGNREYQQWSVPDAYAAGWHEGSAPLGQVGNTVLNGHNNVHGGIFSDLAHLAVGEQIVLKGEEGAVVYRVIHHELLQERGLSLRERLRNARWIAPTGDERLTLVTCWPNTANSHRLIVVAEPAAEIGSGVAKAANERRTYHDSY